MNREEVLDAFRNFNDSPEPAPEPGSLAEFIANYEAADFGHGNEGRAEWRRSLAQWLIGRIRTISEEDLADVFAYVQRVQRLKDLTALSAGRIQ